MRRVWLTRARRSRATTTASPTRASGRCATSPTRGPSSAARTGSTTRPSTGSSPTPSAHEVDSDDPIVLVQDYHFGLLPRPRARAPAARHHHHVLAHPLAATPRASGSVPGATSCCDGLLGSSILGFHTQLHCNNFIEAVDRYLEARIDREQNAVVQGGRGRRWSAPTRSRSSGRATGRPPPRPLAECRAGVFAELGLPADALLGVGVDRLDYTKGIEERLLAVERLLERDPVAARALRLRPAGRAEPHRHRALPPARREPWSAWPRASTRASATAATVRSSCCASHHEPPAVFRYYRAADVCYVSSLHDGMNLVAKEFVAARDDERGVLVLSQFTGAARELTEALDREPLRHRGGQRRPRHRAPHAAPRSSATACARCGRSSPSSTSTAGRAACWWTPPACAGASA